MLFTEPAFLFGFLPLVLALYYATPVHHRNLLLVAASVAFTSAMGAPSPG